MESSQHPDPQQQRNPYQQPATSQTERLHQANPYQQQQQPYAYQMQQQAQPPLPRKPDKVQAIAIMSLVDGILNIIWGVVLIFGICTAPLGLYAIVVAVLGLIYASKLMSSYPQGVTQNKTLAVMQIVNIITGNVASLVMGIITLVFYDDPEVYNYYTALNNQQQQSWQ
jgi:hypothetical protein